MTESLLGVVLEKMSQLMKSGNLIEKEQVEWVYEQMQLLRKFLKDSNQRDRIRNKHSYEEKVKQVVAKIEEVTYRVEDIIESLLLINTALDRDEIVVDVEFHGFFISESILEMEGIYEDCVDQAKEINNGSKPLMEHIDCIKRSKTEMMEILSWLQSKIHHHGQHGCESVDGVLNVIQVEEIKSLIGQVMEIYDNRLSSLRLLDQSSYILTLLHILSNNVLRWAEKNPHPFRHAHSGPSYRIPWLVPLVLGRINGMVGLAKKIHRRLGGVIEELKPIIIQLMTMIYENGLSVTCPDRIRLLFNLFQQKINLTQKIHHEFGVVIEDISKAVNTKPMVAFKPLIELVNEFLGSWFADVDMNGGSLGDVMEDIKSIKREVMEIYEKMVYDIGGGGLQTGSSSHGTSSKPANTIAVEETVVGFDDDFRAIMELLTEQHAQELKIIPIIGMPGLGKTTLAQKLYNDPLIEYHFHIRAWTYVSQVYQKKHLLRSILSSADIQLKGKIDELNDEKLGEQLYKGLKGKRYLVVLDDLWEIRDWNDLKRHFPNDHNGSRIMFTSRLVNVAWHANPYKMRFLNDYESWDLLREKTFGKESCPPELMEIGNQIAKKCHGLPLAIVVLSGVLVKNDKTQEWWRHVAQSVSSYIASDPEQYMETLSLSFNHLPHHLKPCFLYFGAFPEDYEIPVRQLIWLWVSERFIGHNELKRVEDVAEDYLMDLIDRNLVIVSKKRLNGGIKACRIHDLLRDLCLRKAQEEDFFRHSSWYEETSSLNPIPNKQHRFCTNSHYVDYTSLKCHMPHLRSFLSFKHLSLPFVFLDFKLLRVLNLSSMGGSLLLSDIQLLVHLRYLAVDSYYFCPSLSKLWKLETFVAGGSVSPIYLQMDIWKMVKLRHLYAEQFVNFPIEANIFEDHFVLHNLQTISKLNLRGGREHILPRMPNLKKLNCGCNHFPKLDFLIHLETLHVTYGTEYKTDPIRLPHPGWFPPNLKYLTLSFFCLCWEDTWSLGRLPNLEVLKLSDGAFEGSRWDTNDNEFRKLKILKLEGLDIKQWNSSSNHFPNLQRLVLDRCEQLKKIPYGLGDICTLEMIQVRYCSISAETSARKIQAEQQSMGNDGLKIFINTRHHA